MSVALLPGDCLSVLRTLPDCSVQTCVTSPPYFGLRDYGVEGQVGLEDTPEAYVERLVLIFREVRRVLKDDGTVFLNLGDSYYGSGKGRNADGSHQEGGKQGTNRGTIEGKLFKTGANGLCGQSYGNGGKAGQGCQDGDYLSRNPYGVRKDLSYYRTLGNDLDPDSKQVHESCLKILACMEELSAHPPIGDYSPLQQIGQSLISTLDRLQTVAREVEPLLASQVSTTGGFYQRHRANYRLLDSVSACLLSLLSFDAYASLFSRMLGEILEKPDCNQDTALLFEGLAHHIRCTSGYCSQVLSWLNVSYIQPYCTTNLKPKDLIGIPWMVAFALRADGWYLRSEIIWHKPNPMPESVRDRPTKAHEQIFLLSKSPKYFYDAEAVSEPVTGHNQGTAGEHAGNKYAAIRNITTSTLKDANRTTRNRRSVWTVTTKPYKEAHFATFPPDLIEPCILAGTSAKGECPKCGKAWVRVVESTNTREWKKIPSKLSDLERPNQHKASIEAQANTARMGEKKAVTLGWEPQCDCWEYAPDLPIIDGVGFKQPLAPVPQIVLDPFNGSGTTGAVSVVHGRNYIGIELNPAYIGLSERRIQKAQTAAAHKEKGA